MCKELMLNSLTMQSALYDLPDEKERLKSNQELANLFANIVAHSNVDSFYEIGALYAEMSMYLKNVIKNVYAFEASSRNYNLAKEKIEGIEYINMAIADYNGDIVINSAVNEGASIGSDSVLSFINETDNVYEKNNIACMTLDSFIESKNLTNCSNALWIDVEGFTFQVLNGAKNTLKNTKAIFLEVEIAKLWNDQKSVSEINKYLCDNNFIPIARDFEYENKFNIVYVKEDILYTSAVDISLQMFYAGYATKATNYVQKI